jgi:phosphatidylethanolamine/phosphatidyl-N-methylethanolamine N-methyltransferase
MNLNRGELLLFARRWLASPLGVGTLFPSGGVLARTVAGMVRPPGRAPGPVVELGGGTGAITSGLLAAGVAMEDLVVVERDPDFHAALRARFPGLAVVHGDATELSACIVPLGLGPLDAVVSALPVMSMEREKQRRLLAEAFTLLREDGILVQVSFSPTPPFREEDARLYGAVVDRPRWVLANLPPIAVWRYRRQARSA